MNNYDLAKDIGARIRRRRENISMTLVELGSLVNISPASISKIENGVSAPRALSIYMLASALRCTPNDFFPNIERIEVARIQITKVIQKIEE